MLGRFFNDHLANLEATLNNFAKGTKNECK